MDKNFKENNLLGKERFIKKFLWFPKCINHEYRWWERVEIRQGFGRVDACEGYRNDWVDVEWVGK